MAWPRPLNSVVNYVWGRVRWTTRATAKISSSTRLSPRTAIIQTPNTGDRISTYRSGHLGLQHELPTISGGLQKLKKWLGLEARSQCRAASRSRSTIISRTISVAAATASTGRTCRDHRFTTTMTRAISLISARSPCRVPITARISGPAADSSRERGTMEILAQRAARSALQAVDLAILQEHEDRRAVEPATAGGVFQPPEPPELLQSASPGLYCRSGQQCEPTNMRVRVPSKRETEPAKLETAPITLSRRADVGIG